MDSRFEVTETHDHGCILRVKGYELADEFEDFINEDNYVLNSCGFENDDATFWFGHTGCQEKVRNLVEKFLNRP